MTYPVLKGENQEITRNLARNPDPGNTSLWSSAGGSKSVITDGLGRWGRMTVTTAGGPGSNWYHNLLDTGWTVTPGLPYSGRITLRPSKTQLLSVYVQWLNSSLASVGQTILTSVSVNAATPYEFIFENLVAPAGAVYLRVLGASMAGGVAWAVNDTLDWQHFMVNQGDKANPYFDVGSTLAGSTFTWAGTADASQTIWSTAADSIAWSEFTIRFDGASYPIAAGTTNRKFVYWLRNEGGTPALMAADALPAASEWKKGDLLLFLNLDGVPFDANLTQVIQGSLIVDGSIAAEAIRSEAIVSRHIKSDQILANHIASLQIETNKLAAFAVEADKIATNAVTADKVRANEITAAKLATLLVLASQIKISNFMNLDGVEGLVVNHPNGRVTQIHADGSGTEIAGQATLDRATITNNLDVQGTNHKISGTVALPSGIEDPKDKVSAVSTFDDSGQFVNADWTTIGDGRGDVRGLSQYDASNWLTILADSTANLTRFVTINKTTGAFSEWKQVTGIAPWSCWRDAANAKLYVLEKLGVGNWRIARYAESTMTLETSFNVSEPNSDQYNMIGYCDGTYWYTASFVYVNSSTGRLRIRRWTLAGVAAGTMYSTTAYSNAYSFPYDMYVGAGDFGSPKAVFAFPNSVVRVYNTAAWTTGQEGAITEDTASNWSRPYSDNLVGLTYDGTKFIAYGRMALRLYHFSGIKTAAALLIAFSLWDSVATGGEHETMLSPALSFTPLNRFPLRLSATADLTRGGTDDPDRIRFYIDNKRQADLAVGALSTFLTIISTTGAAPQASNGFLTASGQQAGSLRTSKILGGSPQLRLDGDGSWRLGHLSGRSDGKSDMDRCWAFLTAASTTLGGGAWVVQGPSTTEVDTNTMYSAPSNLSRITIKRKGRYRVEARAHWAIHANSNVRGLLVKRFTAAGSALTDIDEQYVTSVAGTQDTTITSSRVVELNAGEYIQAQHRQQSGGSLAIIGGQPHFTAFGVEALEYYE